MVIKPVRIIWHHTGITSQVGQFDVVNEHHRNRGFPLSSLGYYVGYHFLIETDGRIIQARAETEIGAHDQGENYGSIGVGLAGNFSVSKPTKEQEESAAKLVDQLLKSWQIPLTRIEPHRWGDTTECPGTMLGDYWIVFNYLYKRVSWLQRMILRIKGQYPA